HLDAGRVRAAVVAGARRRPREDARTTAARSRGARFRGLRSLYRRARLVAPPQARRRSTRAAIHRDGQGSRIPDAYGHRPMSWRSSLTAKILLLAALNVLVLAAAAVLFAYIELGRDFDSLLLATARERVLAVGRAFALGLDEADPEDATARDRLASQY